MLFASDAPYSCTSPAYMLYELPPDKLVARHLAVQPYRMFGSCPDVLDLCGSLYSSGFALQYAARAGASLQLLAAVWLSQAASQANEAMFAEVASSAISVRQEQMIQGYAVSPSNEIAQSFAPRGYNTAFDHVVGTLAHALIATDQEEKASKLRLCISVPAQGAGGSRFAFPSDCFGRPFRKNASDACDPVDAKGRERVCAELASEWEHLGMVWPNGNNSEVARRAPGCPVRVAFGGVGGGRLLGLSPGPALSPGRAGEVKNRRNFRGLVLEFSDAHGDVGEPLGQRSGPPPPEGDMLVFLSKSGNKLATPPPMSYSAAAFEYESNGSLEKVEMAR